MMHHQCGADGLFHDRCSLHPEISNFVSYECVNAVSHSSTHAMHLLTLRYFRTVWSVRCWRESTPLVNRSRQSSCTL